MTTSSDDDSDSSLPTVGRDSRADLAKYTVRVLGREIIDYNKIRLEDPELYAEILGNEREADRKHQEELDEILALPSTPPESVMSFAAVEKPATGKYFYLPIFISNTRQNPGDEKYEVDTLTYSDDSGRPMEYASRVLPGQTLADAIQNDLRDDFKYDGEFRIVDYYFYDTVPDKHGTPLPRHVVLIMVDQFPTDTLRPANLHAHWSSDGANLLLDYNFQIN